MNIQNHQSACRISDTKNCIAFISGRFIQNQLAIVRLRYCTQPPPAVEWHWYNRLRLAVYDAAKKFHLIYTLQIGKNIFSNNETEHFIYKSPQKLHIYKLFSFCSRDSSRWVILLFQRTMAKNRKVIVKNQENDHNRLRS